MMREDDASVIQWASHWNPITLCTREQVQHYRCKTSLESGLRHM